MKKTFLALAALMGIAAIAGAADYNSKDVQTNVSTPLFQNREVMDQNVVKSSLAYLTALETPLDWQKLAVVRYRVMAYDQTTGADRSAAGLKKYADGLLSEVKFEKPLSGAQYVSIFSLWWRSQEPEFAQGVYELMKATPGAEKFADMGIWANATGHYEEAYNIYFNSKQAFVAIRAMDIAFGKLNDPVKAFAAAKVITTAGASAVHVRKVVNNVVNKLTGNESVKAEDIKTFLQNVNRRYTARLADDSKTWEPVISQVRTLLEAY